MGRVLRAWRVIGGTAIVVLAGAGCTVHDAKAPPLQGPSELGLAFTLSAIPDVLSQDGASQAQIIVQARDANGQPARSVTFRIDTTVDGVLADFGLLSARTLVTDSNGRATVTYTAPPSTTGSVDTGQVVTFQVTPFGTDFASTIPRTVNIRLMPPGVLSPGGPIPSFTFSPAAPSAFTNVLFDASATMPAPSTQIVSYAWNFGDGSTGSGRTFFHQFAAGSYLVTLTVTDTNNISSSTQRSVSVSGGVLPIARFVFSPSQPVVNQDILFNASQSTAAVGRTLVRYDWNFGSGSPQSGVTVSKSYDVPGTYNVVLTVTDDVGQTATFMQPVAVTIAPGSVLTANFTFSPTNPGTGQPVFFNGSASAPAAEIVRYDWNFGDGSPPAGSSAIESHVFTVAPPATSRIFVVRLTVTDTAGRTATTTQNVTVTNP